jgi:sulfhydrogenase subunit beta (sulfur reductase)
MTLVKIDKKWTGTGWLTAAADTYPAVWTGQRERLSPVQGTWKKDETPHMEMVNTRLSPKSLVFPSPKTMLEYSLDQSDDDQGIMKEVPKDDSPRAILGSAPAMPRPRAGPSELRQRRITRTPTGSTCLQRLHICRHGLRHPLSTCFCTTAGCGPYHEEGLDLLVMDRGDAYLAKILTDKGQALPMQAGWSGRRGCSRLRSRQKAAEEKIVSTVETDNLAGTDLLELHGAPFWEDMAFACSTAAPVPFLSHLLVFRHPGRGSG